MNPATLHAQSPRIRTLKQVQRNINTPLAVGQANGGGDDDDNDDINRPKELPLGQEQLFSYHAPGLQAGVYNIEVNQHVQQDEHPLVVDGKPTSDQINPISNQRFDVNAPRFTLPPGIVHQTYPPQGLGDHNNVLPHMVFEDVHLPWEWEGSPAQESKDATSLEADPTFRARNMVPWLALLTFTEDELKLTPAQLTSRSHGGFFPETIQVPAKSNPPPTGREQDRSTFVTHLTMDEYLDMGGQGIAQAGIAPPAATIIAPVRAGNADKPIDDRTQQVDVMFVPRSHFEKLVTPNDPATGAPTPSATADVSRFKYLAHVRNVNTRNMANTGLDDDGLFSVIHAHRTGPLDLTTPKPIIVHLVTLEGVEGMTLPLDSTKSHVALISLYSWTYLCLPPDEVNFVNTMNAIADEIRTGECWLRAPDHVYRPLLAAQTPQPGETVPPKTSMQDRMARRIQDGYTLTRYLLQSGEESVALFRGPLTPTYVPQISYDSSSTWPFQSNFSSDYQIMDRKLGIMDITYSCAWQLGRTLGMADQAFSAALVRLRGSVQRTARWQAKKAMQAQGSNKSKQETFETLHRSMGTLSQLASAKAGAIKSDPASRFSEKKATTPPPTSGNMRTMFVSKAFEHTAQLSSGTPKDGGPQPQTDAFSDDEPQVILPFNEINVPQSSDWQTVQTWILDSLFLRNIPAHYLVSDPSFLPRESMRFFYVDPNWMDAFVDGALSIGNHLDQSDDVVRQAFKHSLNSYLGTTYQSDHLKLNYHPQIPSFGFLLRSSVVKAFPNLEVHAPFPGQEEEGETPVGEPEPTLRLETLEKDVLLCLFDRMPGSTHWSPNQQITIQQPPHQQCFRLGPGAGVTSSTVEVEFGRMLTEKNDASIDLSDPVEPIITWTKGQGPAAMSQPSGQPAGFVKNLPKDIFDWDSRAIIPNSFANACNIMLNNGMQLQEKSYFQDDTPTSAVTGFQLTSYISKMKIMVPAATADSTSTVPPDTVDNPRRIRVPTDYTGPPVFVPPPPTPIPIPTPKPSPSDSQSLSPPAPAPRPIGIPTFFNPDLNPPIPDSEKTHIPANNPGKVLPNGIGPQFVCKVFPLGQAPPKGRDLVQIPQYPPSSDKHIPMDFVIALTPVSGVGASQDTIHNLQLYSVTIDIPVGTGANHLTAKYTVSGGKMLSNLRFNVHVSPLADKVRFTLIPRATSKLVPLRKIPDLNFVVWQIMGNGIVNGPGGGMVRIDVQENYRRVDDGKYFVHFAKNGTLVKKVAAP